MVNRVRGRSSAVGLDCEERLRGAKPVSDPRRALGAVLMELELSAGQHSIDLERAALELASFGTRTSARLLPFSRLDPEVGGAARSDDNSWRIPLAACL
jgi:hypothetical protein